MKAISKKVRDLFVEKYNSAPSLYFSPGRINLIGEHVDYNDGFVMPAAIDRGIYYAIAPNGGDRFNFYSVDFEEQFSTGKGEIRKSGGWKDYVLSVLNEFVTAGKEPGGFDCVFGGDIPIGAGMSSSAAVEGGLAFALNEIFNTGISRIELALLCQRAEHGFPGVNCGIMDQFANLMGKKDLVILLDCNDLSYEFLPLETWGYRIVLVNSKVHHALASGEYNRRRYQCEEGLILLKTTMMINSFRDIRKAENLERYRSVMGEEVYCRCKYVVEEILRTKKAATCLRENDLAGLGKLMYETHEGLSRLYEVSCAELDFLVQQARLNQAVLGARLMGGGFGGCTINIVAESGMQEFIEATGAAYEKKFGIVPETYIVETSDGTHQLTAG